ncbi:MAG: hypothetical protein J7J72_05720 [Bacteroidales bacterium]|nr:hypothetical protein [Bacteroidales bacterium]
MKRYIHKNLFLYLLLSALFIGNAAAQKTEVPLRFDHYYTYDQVVDAVKSLNKAYPDLTKTVLVGKSDENREIWALEINNAKTGKASEKPGVYVDANIHGNEIQAGEVALYFADYLLKNYGELKDVTEIVDRNAYYIIPVVNVDGRYHFMADGNTMNSSRSLRIPKDDDHDGLFDEDMYDDLDGDGNICQMRKKVEGGNYKLDSEDARIMVRIRDGEKGDYVLLGQEGIDNDGDGKINEDTEGYVDPNRNWGANWQPDYVQRGAGDFPFSGVGLKAIANYIRERENIIIVYAFHNNGGMYLRGPSTKEGGPLSAADIAVYDVLGKNAEKMVPGYRYLISWKDLYSTYGDFTDFTYDAFGAYGFVGELFQRETETYTTDKKKEAPEGGGFGRRENYPRQRELLQFNDHLAHGSLFKEWTPYKHPVYGDIEIGGWIKYSSRMPHTFMLPDLVHRNASAVIYAASQTPNVSMEVFKTEKIGKNLNRVYVRLRNSNAISSMTAKAVKEKLYPQDMLKVNGAKVVAGGKLNNKYTADIQFKEHKPEVQFLTVPGYATVEYAFIIEGKGNVEFSYESRKARNVKQSIKL